MKNENKKRKQKEKMYRMKGFGVLILLDYCTHHRV
jgi:hypothetical protein